MQPARKSALIITQKGPCPNTKEGKNHLILDKQLPSDDFEVILKASALFQGAGSYIAMALFGDEANYFRAVLEQEDPPCCNNSRFAAYFQRMLRGQITGSFRGNVGGTDEVYLKIDRVVNQYSGYYATNDPAKPVSADQIQWTKLGTLPAVGFQGRLALCAANFQDAPEISAEFYSVVIRKR